MRYAWRREGEVLLDLPAGGRSGATGEPGEREARITAASLPQNLGANAEGGDDEVTDRAEIREDGLTVGSRKLRRKLPLSDQALELLAERLASEVEIRLQIFSGIPFQTDAVCDELTVSLRCIAPVETEMPEGPVHLEPGRRRLEHRGRAVAAPRPVGDAIDNPGADGVEDDIAAELQEIALLLDNESLESSLEEMAAPPMAAIESFRVVAVQITHSAGEVRDGSFDERW
ncbi:MAG TPA: hypothetical protein VMS12_07320 [Thermoanaerobaculia bacterium]|nr:hypothetical protein [Thermoanaerobaculia bacterium]